MTDTSYTDIESTTTTGGDYNGHGGVMADEQPAVIPERRPPKPKGVCPECKKFIAVDYMSTHRRQQHGVIRRISAKDRLRLEQEAANVKEAELAPAPAKLTPPTAEEIVTMTASLYWPKGIPSSKMGALLRWHIATIGFLKEIE